MPLSIMKTNNGDMAPFNFTVFFPLWIPRRHRLGFWALQVSWVYPAAQALQSVQIA